MVSRSGHASRGSIGLLTEKAHHPLHHSVVPLSPRGRVCSTRWARCHTKLRKRKWKFAPLTRVDGFSLDGSWRGRDMAPQHGRPVSLLS